jgi:hypothetical protein
MSNLFFSANGELMEQPGQLVENMAHEDGHDETPYDSDQERFGNDDEDDTNDYTENMANDDEDDTNDYTENMANDDEDDTNDYTENMTNDYDEDGNLVENMANEDQFDLKGSLNLSGGIKAKDFSTSDGKSLLKMLDQKNTAFNSRLNVNSGKDHIGLNVQSDTDSHIQLKTKNDDRKNVYLINRDGHFRVHHHGVGDMFGVNKDGHTYINSGNNHLGLNVQSNTDSHILLRTKNDARKDLYLINRDGHFRLHQGGVGDMFGVNKDGHHYVRHTGDHVAHLEGDGNNPYITLGKTGTWNKKKIYIQNVNAHTENPMLRIATHGGHHFMDMDRSHGVRWQRKDGRWTHFDWENGMNYIRGNTQHDGDLNVSGKLHLTHAGSGGNNDSDPYYIEKVRAGENNNSLRLTINDDANESFQIWGDSCGAGKCGGPGTMKHNFGANGDAQHTGTLKASKICVGNVCLTDNKGRLQVDAPVSILSRGHHGALNIHKNANDGNDWNYIQFFNHAGQRRAWGGSLPGGNFSGGV